MMRLGVGAVGLQQRALADDRHRFFDGADLQLQVDAQRRIDRHDRRPSRTALLEAGQLRRTRGRCRPSGSRST